MDNDKILKRLSEYYCKFLNNANPTELSVFEELPQLPTAHLVDERHNVRNKLKSSLLYKIIKY